MSDILKKTDKKRSATHYIACAVLIETTVNALFSVAFHDFIKFFYTDYAHLSVWGDIVAIVSVILSFVIYDTFAHKAYKELKSRLMFLGIVYVASKAASIVHYFMGIVAELVAPNPSDNEQIAASIVIGIFEIVIDVISAIWLMNYFDKKLDRE